MEGVNKRRRISFSLSKVGCAPQEINSREIQKHLPFSANWNKRDSVWKTGIHFKTDVFTAVAVVDAKAPGFDSDRSPYSEASQTEWRGLRDFPARISGFFM